MNTFRITALLCAMGLLTIQAPSLLPNAHAATDQTADIKIQKEKQDQK